jgi:hypothetical protein
MALFTDGWRLPPPRSVMDYPASFPEAFGATVAGAIDDSPLSQLYGIAQLEQAKGVDYSQMAGGDGFTDATPAAPPAMVPMAEAKARVKGAGLELKLADGDGIAAPALDIMLDRARVRKERAVTLARGPSGVLPNAALFATGFLVGALDPINVASAFIPVVGEVRYARLLAGAGESLSERASIRAMTGAASGAVGQAAIEPIDWYAHTQDGRDFGMVDVLQNLMFGAALGGTLHTAGGAISDAIRRRRGKELYPFAPGEPHAATNEAFDLAPAVRVLSNLPPQAKQDAMRGAIANLIEGEPVRSAEMLRAAADVDHRIAHSFEPERIRAATISHEGRVYEGANHADAIDKLETHLGGRLDEISDDALSAGFATTKGRLVDREEALQIAQREGQHAPENVVRLPNDAPSTVKGLVGEETRMAAASETNPKIVLGEILKEQVHPPGAIGGATRLPGDVAKPAPVMSDRPPLPVGTADLQPRRALPASEAAPDLFSLSRSIDKPPMESWNNLAHRQKDFEAADALAASREADALPDRHLADPVPSDPTSTWASRATKEAQELAEQADRAFDDAVNVGFLTEHERETVMDRLEAYERENAVRRELLERAAACLAAGLGSAA